MTPLWLVMLAVAQLLGWLPIPPRSLAEASHREAIRRRIVGASTGSYDNSTLTLTRSTGVATSRSTQAAEDGSRESDRGEGWWKERVSGLRDAIVRDEAELAAIDLEIPRLDREALTRDDPAQQAAFRGQAAAARRALEDVRTRIASRRRELAEVLEDARRLDVPPGWLR